MKKTIAVLLTVLMLTGLLTLSAGADSAAEIGAENELDIEEQLRSYLREKYPKTYPDEPDVSFSDYKELYRHDDAGSLDWVLIQAYGDTVMPWYACGVMNHRVVYRDCTYGLFLFGVGLYDAEEDAFYDLAAPPRGVDLYKKYDGLAEAVDQYGIGRLLGDIDCDDEISIIDVTILQRCDVGLREYPLTDKLAGEGSDGLGYSYKYEDNDAPLVYYSDFNRDGERDISDATAIQRFLADLPYSAA